MQGSEVLIAVLLRFKVIWDMTLCQLLNSPRSIFSSWTT